MYYCISWVGGWFYTENPEEAMNVLYDTWIMYDFSVLSSVIVGYAGLSSEKLCVMGG